VTVTGSSGDGSHSSPTLRRLEEQLVRDFVDKLEIANGLKQLLLSKKFTLKLLLNASNPDLAGILGIGEYIVKIISAAIKWAIPEDTASDTSKESISVLTSVTGLASKYIITG
jgi:hypothetical protein